MSESSGPVEQFEITVEESDRGWLVVGDVDGERKVFGSPHPDQDKARFAAEQIRSGAVRWDGAATTG